jgi:hypothetical protein
MAMYNYNDLHGTLPPAVVYGKNGEPLLSWRVLILPHVEQEALYREFHLNEPWDSPHNIKLLPRMPRVYAPPPSKAALVPANHTVVHVFVGKGTAFEGPAGLNIPNDFPDGTSNTLLVVEAGEPVPWTKPQDLIYQPDGPLPPLNGLFKEYFRAAFADAHGEHIHKTVSEATLRAIITRNGGESVSRDW